MFQFVPTGTSQGMKSSIPIAVLPNTKYTFSIYANCPVGKTFNLEWDEQTAAHGFISHTGAGRTGTGAMKRYSVTFTTSSTTAEVILYVLNADASNPTIKVEGLQLEAWPYATPYIPTNTGAVFRPRKANDGLWIEAGVEHEAPTYAWISVKRLLRSWTSRASLLRVSTTETSRRSNDSCSLL